MCGEMAGEPLSAGLLGLGFDELSMNAVSVRGSRACCAVPPGGAERLVAKAFTSPRHRVETYLMSEILPYSEALTDSGNRTSFFLDNSVSDL